MTMLLYNYSHNHESTHFLVWYYPKGEYCVDKSIDVDKDKRKYNDLKKYGAKIIDEQEENKY